MGMEKITFYYGMGGLKIKKVIVDRVIDIFRMEIKEKHKVDIKKDGANVSFNFPINPFVYGKVDLAFEKTNKGISVNGTIEKVITGTAALASCTCCGLGQLYTVPQARGTDIRLVAETIEKLLKIVESKL